MGSDLKCCTGTGRDDNRSEEQIEKLQRENMELKKLLLKERKKYKEVQKTKKNENDKIDKLTKEKKKAFTLLMREKKEHDTISNKLVATTKRMSKIEEKNIALIRANEEYKQQAIQSISEQDETESDNNDDNKMSPYDNDADPRSDCTKLRNWLIYRDLNEKDLKTEFAKLLSCRNESHRSKIPSAYSQRYGSQLMDDINKKLRKGHVLHLIHGLLKTRAVFDAICIKEAIIQKSLEDIAAIICCRNINELQLIYHEYKKLYQNDLKEKIEKLSGKKTFKAIIEYLFTFKRDDNESHIMNDDKVKLSIKSDIDYITDKNIAFKNFTNKKKLALIIMGNNKQYIRKLNDDFFVNNGSTQNLIDFIDDELGKSSTAGFWLKERIKFCLDSNDYYARKIHLAGDKWKSKNKNSDEINKIFISKFDDDLKNIESKFNQFNYGNGKSMKEWIASKCPGDRYAFFLNKMLENCKRI